jgi:hypothetical protein
MARFRPPPTELAPRAVGRVYFTVAASYSHRSSRPPRGRAKICQAERRWHRKIL